MGHTAEDWSGWGRLEALLQRFDDYEIASRLGGPMTPHKDGFLLQFVDFEDGLRGWALTGSGTGEAQTRSVEYARLGQCSMKLKAGDAVGNRATAERSWGFPNAGKVGVEFSWAGNGVDLRVHLKLRHYRTNRIRRYGIRIDTDQEDVEYLSAGDVWTAWQTEVPIYNALGHFNVAKLVIDMTNHAYVKALLNDTEYEITTTQSSVAGVVNPNILSVEIAVESRDSANAIVYIDEVTITDGERTGGV